MNIAMRGSFLTCLLLGLSGTAYGGHHDGCPGPEKLKLDLDTNSIKFQAQKPVCIVLGESFKIDIKVNPSSGIVINKGDVYVTPKKDADVDISGNNSVNEDELIVTVSGSIPADPISGFDIHIKDVGMLDPKVRVVDNETMRIILYDSLSEHLSDLGISWDYVLDLHRDFGGDD